ncbi:lysophospholipid acyltransferase family protein [Candidatus Uabimicrobium amorphum]|uniref:DUF374 domain-containing protein n=1 Tax=Uabimicrobium amorphum TaxID=2596890 RepID=A0A5S9IPC8_UABAM|nr:DUF374 domain-containing protein [Candidatus Uabimicrobium amorphum]BBM85618.1 hypothetical protein UABAM_03992 [Candidatus Uabimicrobium amorphum]
MGKRTLTRHVIRRTKRALGRSVLFILKNTIPHMYAAYCSLVWYTSKVVDNTKDIEEFFRKENKPVKFVGVMWHQDVFLVTHAFHRFPSYTIASQSNAGEVITRMLQKYNFHVFRGGTSKGKKRRVRILDEIIEHLATVDKFGIGITVDGSSGPIYQMKTGALVVGMKLNVPVFSVRIWCKRKFLLPTWDRTMIPLPFNNIKIFLQGPYFPPSEENSAEFDAFHQRVQEGLLQATYDGFQHYEKQVSAKHLAGFPENWQPKNSKYSLT